MSTDLQRYSIQNQSSAIRAYAQAHGMQVVKTFADSGKSGVTIKGRSGLTSLLADVLGGQTSYEVVLVYDVSRWGRFQDADESAHYEFVCKQAGVQIIYCAEQFGTDNAPYGGVMKALKRVMAGEFSRELSSKVAVGKARIGQLGYRVGGIAGYGLRRQLFREGTIPGAVLRNGEWKSIQSDRVRLIPGPQEEVEIVRRIYKAYVYLRRSEREIANDLNAESLQCFERPWTRALVRTVLSNEKYIGNNIVGMVSYRLGGKPVLNPRTEWVRSDGAFTPIVSCELFQAAAKVRQFNSKIHVTREQVIAGLRRLLREEGALSTTRINETTYLPSANTVIARFGTLTQAYRAVGYTPRKRYRFYSLDQHLGERRSALVAQVVHELRGRGLLAVATQSGDVEVQGRLKLHVMFARRQIRHREWGNVGWRFCYLRNSDSDLVLAARLDSDSSTIKDFVVARRADLAALPEFVRERHAGVLYPYLLSSLDAALTRVAGLAGAKPP